MGTVLEGLKALFATLFQRSSERARANAGAVFLGKYRYFQSLLESNTDLLKIFSEMEAMQSGKDIFGMGYIRSRSSRAIFHTIRMIKSFERLSGRPQPVLLSLVDHVAATIREAVDCRTRPPLESLVLDLADITGDMADQVGGKCANLGELANRLELPVPDGFAVTTTAFRAFFEKSGLAAAISSRLSDLLPEDAASLAAAARDIQDAIINTPLPDAVVEGLYAAATRVQARHDGPLRFAVRSSAIGEDGDRSFAGQYLTLLGVAPENLEPAYRQVVASLYSPRAMAYRLYQGLPEDDAIMAVACLVMVPSQAAGVLFTKLPDGPERNELVINAVWGLGSPVADGTAPSDTLHLHRETLHVTYRETPDKPRMLTVEADGTIVEREVSLAKRAAPCLSDAQARQLAVWGLNLERHYGRPQDMEWAIRPSGEICILQTRPLTGLSTVKAPVSPPTPGARILATGGQTACSGVGAGAVHIVRSDADLATFPQGAVLVAPHSSPQFMVAMRRAAAIVTEHGSVTGHMASLSREFGVPTLLGIEGATSLLAPGERITVDATSGRIYQGTIDELVSQGGQCPLFVAGTQLHAILHSVSQGILPLHLLDPKAPNFKPEGCSSLHDITRLLHEWSYGEMFAVSDLVAGQPGFTAVLAADTGLDLRIIDLGGGIQKEAAGQGKIVPGAITSRPFAALLSGLILHKENAAPRPVNFTGFLSVVSEQMLARPQAGNDRFGEKSYAIIADKYCNFSSRIGYHYGVLDSYCGATVNKNYITFSFSGGAADTVKRERRVRAIARILATLGFSVDAVADQVNARFQKFPAEVIAERLGQLGRLLQFTRQADMLMVNEESVELMVACFLSGAVTYDPDKCPVRSS